MSVEEETPPGLIVRQAGTADNDSLIDLELRSPLLIGDVEESFDRSPDFFACHRVQGDHRVVLAELDGRLAGVMAGVVHKSLIQGRAHRLVYIQRARVHPDLHGRGVAWALAKELFAWAGEQGVEGPYYLISPENKPSVAFVQRGGGRWPVDVTLLEFDVSEAQGRQAVRIPEKQLEEAVGLVNRSHQDEDFFEPLTVKSLTTRLSRDKQYSIENLYGIFEGGTLVAMGGLWDKGVTTERLHVERTTGVLTRSRGAAVVDWGWAVGRSESFAELLRSLAVQARALGRSTLTICEPGAGSLPDPGLVRRRSTLSLFTPTMQPPAAESIRGVYVDLLQL